MNGGGNAVGVAGACGVCGRDGGGKLRPGIGGGIMPLCMLLCINCSHSGGICGGQFKAYRVSAYASLSTCRTYARSLTSRGKLWQVALVFSMPGLGRVWLWGQLLQTGHVPARRRRRGVLLLAILVCPARRLLHLREWKGKWHPGWKVVVRHCGRSAARRGRSFARSSAHRARQIFVDCQTC